ncbi:hypothetical protein [Vibrio phage vB_pir03]|nr:hypothetical protein [Vibrio phage vB_pir03]
MQFLRNLWKAIKSFFEVLCHGEPRRTKLVKEETPAKPQAQEVPKPIKRTRVVRRQAPAKPAVAVPQQPVSVVPRLSFPIDQKSDISSAANKVANKYVREVLAGITKHLSALYAVRAEDKDVTKAIQNIEILGTEYLHQDDTKRMLSTQMSLLCALSSLRNALGPVTSMYIDKEKMIHIINGLIGRLAYSVNHGVFRMPETN